MPLMAALPLRSTCASDSSFTTRRINSPRMTGYGITKEAHTMSKYRSIASSRKAAAAGFDRIHFDDFWYAPARRLRAERWLDNRHARRSASSLLANGMKPGHWFSLQGKYCYNGMGQTGAIVPTRPMSTSNSSRCEEIFIGKYHTAWDQLDAGLLWKTDKVTNAIPSSQRFRVPQNPGPAPLHEFDRA